MTEFAADNRPHKVDLGVGVYRNDQGETPIMSSVLEAESKILKSATTKAYEGPRGNRAFCSAIETLLFGNNVSDNPKTHIASFATPGGCGALALATKLAAQLGVQKVWVSDPTWPNHGKLIQAAGLDGVTFRYRDRELGVATPEQMFEDLSKANAGDAVLVQGPCHNPTGIDLSVEDWTQLGHLIRKIGLVAILDVAYHGFGDGLEEDRAGIRAFIEAAGEVLVSYSCSKNFGLYRERTGCLMVVTNDADASSSVASHIEAIARTSWSMPPAHGAAIVATIMVDTTLRETWESELSQMRARVKALRLQFSTALAELSERPEFNNFAEQNGMFCQVPISPDDVAHLRSDAALYLPKDGRLNLAGMHEKDVQQVAKHIANVLRPER